MSWRNTAATLIQPPDSRVIVKTDSLIPEQLPFDDELLSQIEATSHKHSQPVPSESSEEENPRKRKSKEKVRPKKVARKSLQAPVASASTASTTAAAVAAVAVLGGTSSSHRDIHPTADHTERLITTVRNSAMKFSVHEVKY